MKYSVELAKRLTPEWRTRYIQYEQLKAKLYEISKYAKRKDVPIEQQLEEGKMAFFEKCTEELHKIDTFFKQKMDEAVSIASGLNRGVEILLVQKSTKKTLQAPGVSEPQMKPKSMNELKSDFSLFYLKLIALQNFKEMNKEGFRKILKKYDKFYGPDRGKRWMKKYVHSSGFALNKDIDKLIVSTENSVAKHFEHGDRLEAIKFLRVPPINEAFSVWTTFWLGFTISTFLMFSLIIGYSMTKSHPTEPRWVGVRLFRGWCFLFANIFLFGVNMFIWQKNGVSHILIFEINQRDHLPYQSVMLIASTFLTLLAFFAVCYMYSFEINVPSTCIPVVFIGIVLIWLFQPFPCCVRSSRAWFLKHLIFCMFPFLKVTFPDFFLADQMSSLVTFFLDLEYTVCFYYQYVDYSDGWSMKIAPFNETTTLSEGFGIDIKTGADTCTSNVYGIRPMISCMPALFRILQCTKRYFGSRKTHPHLTNVGKYSTTIFVVLFGSLNTLVKKRDGDNVFFVFWIAANLISFMYTFWWDIKMDWGLFNENAPKEAKFLRADLMYSPKLYYGAMVFDFILRWAWLINVSTGDSWSNEHDLLMLVTGGLECCRRFVWNWFRLENEHLNNCGEFRETRNINVAPISSAEFEDDESIREENKPKESKSDKSGKLKRKKSKKKDKSQATLIIEQVKEKGESIDSKSNPSISVKTISHITESTSKHSAEV